MKVYEEKRGNPMKVLIWIISAFVTIFLNELLGVAIGYKLGYVLVSLLICVVAAALCKFVIKEDTTPRKSSLHNPQADASTPIPGGWTCSACGANCDAGTNFCNRCGAPKPAAEPQTPVEMTRPQEPPVEMTRPQVNPAAVPPENHTPPAVAYRPGVAYIPPQPPPEPQKPASIRFHVSSLNTSVTVTRPSFTVGRDGTSDLSLSRLPNARYVARRQASFFCSGGKWYIRDENSTNGTFLNQRQIPGGKPYPLNKGDFISFAGKETLIVQDLT